MPGRLPGKQYRNRATAPGTLLGVLDVAQELEVSRSTVDRWLKAGKLPPPLDRTSAGPIWERADIERFKRKREA